MHSAYSGRQVLILIRDLNVRFPRYRGVRTFDWIPADESVVSATA